MFTLKCFLSISNNQKASGKSKSNFKILMYLLYLSDAEMNNQDALPVTALLNSVWRRAISRQDAAPCDQTTLVMYFFHREEGESAL